MTHLCYFYLWNADMQEPVSIYKEKIDRTRLMLKNLQRLINFNALFRLLSFIGLVAAIYYSFTDFRMIYLIAGILFFALFIFWVRKSGKMSHQKSILNKLIFINENELAILQGRNSWFDAGEKFISSKGYSTDLDIFGYQSLYHLLNRTTTGDGSRRLVGMLSAPMTEKEKIEQYQQAVQLLTPQLENRQSWIASLNGSIAHHVCRASSGYWCFDGSFRFIVLALFIFFC